MSPMSRSDARKRNTNPRDQEHDMATDHRKAAQSLLDGDLVDHGDLDTIASAAVHALLAIHDTLAEIRDRLPEPQAPADTSTRERTPEGDPDEALARMLWEIDDPEPTYGWDRARANGVYQRMARAAREHIEAEVTTDV